MAEQKRVPPKTFQMQALTMLYFDDLITAIGHEYDMLVFLPAW